MSRVREKYERLEGREKVLVGGIGGIALPGEEFKEFALGAGQLLEGFLQLRCERETIAWLRPAF